MTEKVTLNHLAEKKRNRRNITMLTCYDYTMALLIDEAGIDISLVGDSLANIMLGYASTVPVTLDDIIHHASAVARGTRRAFLVGDMPFMTYNISVEEAIRNCGRVIKEAGMEAVKMEGGREIAPVVKAVVDAGIPVMTHMGFTPQTAVKLGGSVVQGRDAAAAQRLIDDAKMLEDAGAFSLVLECVPDRVAKKITESTSMIIIGIGAGPDCDGQVLVTHDMLGLTRGRKLKFVQRYGNLAEEYLKAFRQYLGEVESGKFPTREHSFTIKDEEFERLK